MVEKQILIFVRPPLEISQRIYALWKEISGKYTNKYMAHAQYVWESHLMAYISPMPEENLQPILKATEAVANNVAPFEVTLGEIIPISGGFIAIDVQSDGLMNLRDRIVPALSTLRGSGIKPHYQQKWDLFTPEEKERIHATGLPYLYNPHLTLARLNEEDMRVVLEVIRAKESFVGEQFVAKELLVAQEIDDPTRDWPIVGEFPIGGNI